MTDEQQVIIPQKKKYKNPGFRPRSVRKLYLEAKSSDIKFLFGSTESTGAVASVAAHKNLLAAASGVFDAMFYGDLKEKGDVHIIDSSEAAFVEFLQFFYLAEVELTEENFAGVMYLGHKYNVVECISVCNRFLKDAHSAENILVILDLGITYDQQELMEFCEKYIISDTAAVLKSASFLECDNGVIGHILKMDLLSCPEVELFEACMSWVKAKSGQESVSREMVGTHLGELYYQIRFASMTMKDLFTLTNKYDLVLRSDFVTLSKMITVPGYQPKDFNSSPRHIKWNTDAAIECLFRNRYGADRIYQLSRNKSITFSTSERLVLGGFTCGKIVRKQQENGKFLDLSSDLLVDVDVMEATDLNGTNCKVLSKMKAHLQSADTKVVLSRPTLIRPGYFYKISLGPFTDDRSHYSKPLKSQIEIKSKISIELHNCNTANNPENEYTYGKAIGLIWSLDFNDTEF